MPGAIIIGRRPQLLHGREELRLIGERSVRETVKLLLFRRLLAA